MTTKLSLCLWPLQVAGFFSLRFTIVFHLTRNINSFHILHEVAVAELHFGPRHYLSCWFALCPAPPPPRIASWDFPFVPFLIPVEVRANDS